MSRLFNICLLLLVLLAMCPAALPVKAASNNPSGESTLLQFSSGGHMLGFSEDGIYAAAGDHALKVDFVNAAAVKPVAEAGAGVGNSAAPLVKVNYTAVWRGVDLEYTSVNGGIAESTYYLNTPEAVNGIRLCYNRPVSLDTQGNLVISFERGNMMESAPVAWQEVDGLKQHISASYVIYGEKEIGFALAGYQPGIPVVIDPSLAWNTFLGSSNEDECYGVVTDSAGNIYVTGTSSATWGSPLRAYTGLTHNAFVAKLNSDGTLIWNTFLGDGTFEEGYGIIFDPDGNIFVVGESSGNWGSPLSPYTTGNAEDAFVAKLNNSGVYQWHFYLGGIGSDRGYGVALDASHNIHVTGWSTYTWGTPKREFTTGTQSQDAFVAMFNSSGVIQWNTFLGSSDVDYGYAIVVDGSGNSYVSGYGFDGWAVTGLTPIRAYTGDEDGFVTKLNNAGEILWFTFLGGTTNDQSMKIALDSGGNLYVAGYSTSAWGIPLTPFSGSMNGFVVKLNNSGAIQWLNFIAGDGMTSLSGIALGPTGDIFSCGYSAATWGAPVRPFTAMMDGVVVKLNSNGTYKWHAFLGGSAFWEWAQNIAVDRWNSACVIGITSATWGSPLRPFSTGSSTLDGWVAKLLDSGATQTSFNTTLGTVNLNTGAGHIANAGWTTAGDIRCSAPSGFNFPYGMFSFNINDLLAGHTAVVTLKFPNPLPLGTKYFKCINGSMVDVTSLVTRVDEYTLQLALTDGGLGDADGTANGTIVDPGGPAFPFNIQPQSSSAQMTVTTPQKPISLSNIAVKSASLSAMKVMPGTAVTVIAEVANTGTGNGSSVVKVYVNGAEEAQQGVSVNSGGTTTVSFEVSRNEPGTYTVYVGGTNAGSFTVEQFTPDTILFISGSLVLFSLIMGVIWVTRRKSL